MRTFGLTGGIGTGKSTVAQMLRDVHQIPVVDADQAARDVVAPGSDGLEAIVQAFGPDALTPDGALDRSRMRARILADAEARATLEAITHPRIFQAIRGALAELEARSVPLAGVEAALMVETGSYRLYDSLVVVSCTPEHQIERVMARDQVPEASARAMLAVQRPMADKEAVATHVIRNDGTLEDLRTQVAAVAAALRAQGAGSTGSLPGQ